ncbi:MAG: hypothetical protein ACI9KE_003587 [Polyangiales bacterium]|jgi:hypothetical protein
MAVATLGTLVLLAYACAFAWRRFKNSTPRRTRLSVFASWTLVGLSVGVLATAVVGLLRVVIIGLPLALVEYIWLYAAPLLWAGVLAYEAFKRPDERVLLVTGAISLAYFVLFASVSLVFRPGPRIPASAVVEVVVSYESVCERYASGEVLCRGAQLGVEGRWPVPVDAPAADRIYLGGGRACLRSATSPAELWCWTDSNPALLEVQGVLGEVLSGDNALLIHEGTGLRYEGEAAQWPNARGFVTRPDVLTTIEGASDAAFSRDRVCVVEDHQVRCARTLDFRDPQAFQLEGALSPADQVVVGGDHACSWSQNTVRCDGVVFGGEFRLEAAVENVTVGSLHACALAGGSVYCWGRGRAGVLGTGIEDQAQPIRVELNDITQIAGTGEFVCALTGGEGPTTQCWGVAPPQVNYDEEPRVDPGRGLSDIFRRRLFRDEPTLLQR